VRRFNGDDKSILEKFPDFQPDPSDVDVVTIGAELVPPCLG
jgi:hypothetical protein